MSMVKKRENDTVSLYTIFFGQIIPLFDTVNTKRVVSIEIMAVFISIIL